MSMSNGNGQPNDKKKKTLDILTEKDDELSASTAIEEGTKALPCWIRARMEFTTRDLFSLEEHNGRQIHVRSNFAPKNTFYIRLLLFIWSAFTLLYDFLERPQYDRSRYMLKLTHWTYVITLAYQYLALLLYKNNARKQQRKEPQPQQQLDWCVKLVWALYSISVTCEVAVALLYWKLEYTGQSVTYSNYFKHGIIAILVLIDGNILSRIPLRMNQLVFPVIYMGIYAAFTLVYAFSGNGGGRIIYRRTLNWRQHPKIAGMVSMSVTFIAVPFLFLCCWLVSLWSGGLRFDGRRRWAQRVGTLQQWDKV